MSDSDPAQQKKTPERDQIDNLAPIALVSQLGFVFAAPVVGCALAAYYLERRFGGGGGVIVAGVLLGVALGIVGAYRIIKPFLD